MLDEDAVEFKLYRYDPSAGAAAVFCAVFLMTSTIHAYQLARTRTWFFIPFVLGGFFEFFGYMGRIESANQTPNWTTGPYIQQTLLLLIAPTLFAASVYMELGRIIILTDGEEHSLVPRKWLTKIFLIGDITSFFMQGAGGGIMASGNIQSLHTGEKIIIGGLVVQLLFFALFIFTTLKFHFGLKNNPNRKVLTQRLPWERHILALYIGSLLILVRSIFRLIEYAQGNAGYLVSHEAYMYVFDGSLMMLTMMVFLWIHPSEINALLNPTAAGKAVKRVFSVYTLHQFTPN